MVPVAFAFIIAFGIYMLWNMKGPEEENADTPVNFEEVAYIIVSATIDETTCSACKAKNECSFLPEYQPWPHLPNPDCSSSRNCTCIYVYVLKDERGSEEVVEFIRSIGGLATKEQLDARENERIARVNADNERREKIHHFHSVASTLEKSDPKQSAELYRRGIDRWIELCRETDSKSDWRGLPPLFSRLTFVLEREKRYQEVLDELAKYRALPCFALATKADQETMRKRETRIQQRLHSSRG